MSVVAVSDAAALAAALKAAQPGDVIALAAGRYEGVVLSKLNFSGVVTITSQDSAAPAEIAGLKVSGCSGLAFSGLTVVSDAAHGSHPNVVSGSSRVSFDQVYFHGSLNDDPTDDTGGLQIRGSTDVSVTNSTFEQLLWGISHLDDTRLTISGNEFHDLRMDGIRGGGSSHVTITGNSFRDFFIKPGDHGDVIQFWTSNTTASARDILIADNLFVRGDGYYVQGICLRDERGDMPYEHVVIRGNLLVGSTFNAITVGNARDVTVEGNVVQAFADKNSYIRLNDIQGLTLADNAAMTVKFIGSTDVTETGTRIIPVVADGGAAAIHAWLASKVTILSGGPENDVLSGGPENDVLVGVATGSLIRGGEGDDILRGSANFDDIHGNQGDDTASGGSGDDWVVGGKDNDSLSGDSGNDLVYGNLGNDTCDGGSGDDTIRGGQQDDVLRGGAGDDYLSGDRGADTLTGGAGADTFHSFGDAGLDLITDFNAAEGDRLLLDAGTTYVVIQDGADTVVSMFGGGQVILAGVSMSDLTGDWIGVG